MSTNWTRLILTLFIKHIFSIKTNKTSWFFGFCWVAIWKVTPIHDFLLIIYAIPLFTWVSSKVANVKVIGTNCLRKFPIKSRYENLCFPNIIVKSSVDFSEKNNDKGGG